MGFKRIFYKIVTNYPILDQSARFKTTTKESEMSSSFLLFIFKNILFLFIFREGNRGR